MPATYTILCFLLFTRSIFAGRVHAHYRPTTETTPPPADPDAEPRELPETASLAGMPLRLFLSERWDPGASLRESLRHRPSPGGD